MKRLAWLLMIALVTITAFADFLASDKPLVLFDGEHVHVMPAWTRPRDLPDESIEEFRNRSASFDGWLVPPLVSFGPNQTQLQSALQPPSASHPFGTDELGRDVFARVVHGGRVSLFVSLCAVAMYALLGVCLGAFGGYYGGAVDGVISRVSETLLSFPTFFLVLCVMGITRAHTVLPIILVLGLTRWPEIARLVRAEVLRLRTQEFVQASRALGASDARLIARHLIPHALSPVVVAVAFGVPSAILIESALSFLGFGVPPPAPSWGELLTQAHRYVTHPGAWWLTFFPGLALFATVAAFHLLGESIRDVRDPTSSL